MYQLRKEFKLDSYGWADCSLWFYALSYEEMRELDKWRTKVDPNKPQDKDADRVFEILERQFISGKAGEDKREVKAAELRQLPFEVVIGVSNWLLNGDLDPNYTAG